MQDTLWNVFSLSAFKKVVLVVTLLTYIIFYDTFHPISLDKTNDIFDISTKMLKIAISHTENSMQKAIYFYIVWIAVLLVGCTGYRVMLSVALFSQNIWAGDLPQENSHRHIHICYKHSTVCCAAFACEGIHPWQKPDDMVTFFAHSICLLGQKKTKRIANHFTDWKMKRLVNCLACVAYMNILFFAFYRLRQWV